MEREEALQGRQVEAVVGYLLVEVEVEVECLLVEVAAGYLQVAVVIQILARRQAQVHRRRLMPQEDGLAPIIENWVGQDQGFLGLLMACGSLEWRLTTWHHTMMIRMYILNSSSTRMINSQVKTCICTLREEHHEAQS